jgi:hypothetical protein
MRLSSLAQAAVATLTRNTPSGVTDSGAVTAAIWGPTSSGQASTTPACSILLEMPERRR